MPDVQLTPVRNPFQATVTPPGSKSLSNCALVLASMAKGRSTLSNVLFADDTRVMLDALVTLGYELDIDEAGRTVTFAGGEIPSAKADLFCGNSGTTLRFLAAAVARGKGRYRLDGVERMRQRPLGHLGQLLKDLGVRVHYDGQPGYPPVVIEAAGLPGGLLKFGDAVSSQYLSAVLMVAPFGRHEVQVALEGRQSSWPYVAMTMRLMDVFGHTPELERDPDTGEPVKIVIPRGGYVASDYRVEPDASNASYFMAAAAIHPGSSVTIEGLGRHSLQGDVAIAEMLGEMGATVVWGRDDVTVTGTTTLKGIDRDMTATPDLAQTLAVTALFASSPTTLRGLHTLRVKETDRVAALDIELTKLGGRVEVTTAGDDVEMVIHPTTNPQPAEIATYDDHRMAMAFAVAATKAPGIVIKDAQCCAKTYPQFFDDLRAALKLG